MTDDKSAIPVSPIALAVAEALSRLTGHTWTAGAEPERPEGYVHLARADGPSIYLSTDRYGPRRRLHAGGDYPRGDHGDYYGPRGASSISMDPGKAPETIARDIARRLLPEYLPEWLAAMARKAQADAYRAATSGLARRLAEVCGARPPREDRGESMFYLDGARVRTHGDTATLELTVSGDLAERILRLMVEAHSQAPEPERYLGEILADGEEVPYVNTVDALMPEPRHREEVPD